MDTKSKIIIFLLFASVYGLGLEVNALVAPILIEVDMIVAFLVMTSFTFLILVLAKIVLDLLYAVIDISNHKPIITVFPFIFINKKRINIRLSPYFSLYRKSLRSDKLTAKMIASLLLGLVLFMAFSLSNLVLNIVFTSVFFGL